MALCKVCGNDFPKETFLKHMWDDHRDVMVARRRQPRGGKGNNAKSGSPETAGRTAPKNGSKPLSAPDQLASVTTPAAGAQEFKFTKEIINIDPNDFSRAYIIYQILKAEKIIVEETFSQSMLGAFETVYSLTHPQTLEAQQAQADMQYALSNGYMEVKCDADVGNPESSIVEDESQHDEPVVAAA